MKRSTLSMSYWFSGKNPLVRYLVDFS